MEKYRIIKKVSESPSSRVSLASLIGDSRSLVIIKEIACTGTLEQVFNESKVLANLSHPNIVKLIECFVLNYSHRDSACVCIVTEYCEGGDISRLIRNSSGCAGAGLNNEIIKEVIVQLLLAINYLHDKNVLHRDLKLKNIFISSRPDDRILRIKIGDFGIARKLETDQMATTLVGTPYYMSPEVCTKRPYDKSVDIWSLGCVIYEILSEGQHPFNARSFEELMGRIRDEPIDYTGISNWKQVEMLKRMLCKNPRDRLTIDELLHLPLIQEYIQEFVTKISSINPIGTVLTPPATSNNNNLFFSNTSELLLNTMQTLINTKASTPSGDALEDAFHRQLKEASECLIFLQSNQTEKEKFEKEFEHLKSRLSKLFLLPSRIQRFCDAIKNGNFDGLKEMGDEKFIKEVFDEKFIKEVLGNGLVGDTLVLLKYKNHS